MRPFLALTLLGFTGFAATLAALPLWAVENGASTATSGLVSTVMLAATVLAQPFVPALLTRARPGTVLAVGLAVLGAPSVLLLGDADLPFLLAVNAARGVGFAVLTVVGSALTALLAPPGRHGEMAGQYGLAIAVPNLLVVPGAVWLAQNVGFLPVVVLATLPVLAVPLALRLQTPPVPGHRRDGGARGGLLVVVAATATPAVILTVVTLAGGALFAYLPIERSSGLLATAALLLVNLTAAIARWRVGAVGDRHGTRVLLPGSVFIGAVGMAGVAAGLGLHRDVLTLTGAALFGIGYGAVQNLTLVVAFARAGRHGIGTASAVWNAGFDAGTGLGPLVVGALVAVGFGVPTALWATAALVALTAPVAVLTGRLGRWRRAADVPQDLT